MHRDKSYWSFRGERDLKIRGVFPLPAVMTGPYLVLKTTHSEYWGIYQNNYITIEFYVLLLKVLCTGVTVFAIVRGPLIWLEYPFMESGDLCDSGENQADHFLMLLSCLSSIYRKVLRQQVYLPDQNRGRGFIAVASRPAIHEWTSAFNPRDPSWPASIAPEYNLSLTYNYKYKGIYLGLIFTIPRGAYREKSRSKVAPDRAATPLSSIAKDLKALYQTWRDLLLRIMKFTGLWRSIPWTARSQWTAPEAPFVSWLA